MPSTSLIQNYPHRMGGHCGSGAMRDLMHWHGLGWGGPPDEGLVFTLGGALGLSYLRSTDLVPPLYLVGRGGDFEVDLPRRLGGQVQVLTTDDPSEGWSWVRDEVDAGRPSLVWADIAELPYLRVRLQMSRHDIVVIGYDEETGVAFVVDNDRAEVQEVPLDALARARCSTSFPQPTRHCTYRIIWPKNLPAITDTAAAAFRQSANNMRSPFGATIAGPAAAGGAEGMAAVEELVADIGTWGSLPDNHLEVLLFSLGAFIEKAGTGGGLFRRLLAEGCAEVARLTGDLPSADLAEAASRCAQAWTETARAGVQRDVDVRARLDAVALAASRLPQVEVELVAALELASSSLTAASR
ncbi:MULTISPECIES: BtrH N-terminal domain-containing protein [Nocardia]|uniref:BtrH N-terminal domain-containing protein n=1 Tax=Nocardia TaxID=1817 RepID=UPI0007EBE1BD|nr:MULTISPECIES: BtrH N-terminal domain-containing protein [Nocardia]MBF6278389.1 BtrH N-terminal domain-containing protein [Nocardia nova]OBA47867.1 PRTRC system protein E [Nocardia sp. 852002-51101_SCH5132738]OBB30234.1 PRTRC system protein E [Nocardia sp. 852002-51244_SCH5132740]OBF68024.1 PRTRC system protein E [Mycobacterium sp. 852002-51759_SCH5129042]